MTADKIKDKLGKLKAMAEGAEAIGNEAEAQAFAEMFQRLLLKHKLDMSDLDFSNMEKEEPVDRHFIDYKNYPEFEKKKTRVQWQEWLSQIVAKAHFCDILVWNRTNRICIVGRKSDAVVAEYMIITMVRAADKIATKAYADFSVACVNECARCGKSKSSHYRQGTTLRCVRDRWEEFVPNWAKCRGYKQSFLEGFIQRIQKRYEEALHIDESTALVRINKAQKAVLQWMEDNMKDKNASVLSRQLKFNRHGRDHGRDAADKINLHGKAVVGGEQQRRLK